MGFTNNTANRLTKPHTPPSSLPSCWALPWSLVSRSRPRLRPRPRLLLHRTRPLLLRPPLLPRPPRWPSSSTRAFRPSSWLPTRPSTTRSSTPTTPPPLPARPPSSSSEHFDRGWISVPTQGGYFFNLLDKTL